MIRAFSVFVALTVAATASAQEADVLRALKRVQEIGVSTGTPINVLLYYRGYSAYLTARRCEADGLPGGYQDFAGAQAALRSIENGTKFGAGEAADLRQGAESDSRTSYDQRKTARQKALFCEAQSEAMSRVVESAQ